MAPHQGVEPLLHAGVPPRLGRPCRHLRAARLLARILLACYLLLLSWLLCLLLLRSTRCPTALLLHRCILPPISVMSNSVQVLEPAHPSSAVADLLDKNHILQA